MPRGRGGRFVRVLAVALTGAAVGITACDPGEVALIGLSGSSDEAVDSVVVTVLRPDSSPAADARVVWLRVDTNNYAPEERRTDGDGRLVVRLRGGSLYWVAAELNDPARGLLGGGGKIYGPRKGPGELTIHLAPPRTSGLVLSEIYVKAPQPWETGGVYYEHGKYLELANIGEAPVALDGTVVGKAYLGWYDSGAYGHHRCEDTAPMRADSAGVWSYIQWSIPGSGSEHILGPGEAAVIAVSASDHSDIHPSMLDLSEADFEFRHPAVADNPAAPDMVLEGPNAPNTVTNDFSGAFPFWAITSPTDPSALLTADDPGSGLGGRTTPYRLLPSSALQDVVYAWQDWTGAPFEDRDPCLHPVHPRFDAVPGPFFDSSALTASPQRRRVTVDGRPILLDTNTTYIDFAEAERTPGWLP